MNQKTYELQAETRTLTGKKVKQLRSAGQMPVVVYGASIDPQPLSIDAKTFKKVYDEAGNTSLIDLKFGDKSVKVLVQDVAVTPLHGEIIHADLFAVNLKEKVETEIPLKFINESEAVVELEGSLVTNKTEVTVEALPTDLISEIEVDLSALKTFDDQIKVQDIKVPSTITIMNDPEEVVAFVEEPMSQEELEAELAADAGAAEAAAVEELGAEPAPAEGEEGEGAQEQPSEDKKEE